MKGKWDVAVWNADGSMGWRAYRLRDIGEVDHAGNREWDNNFFQHRKEAEEWADFMNKVEEVIAEDVVLDE